MKFIRFFKSLLENSLIILGTAFLVIKLIDLYNPFLDISGHSQWLRYLLGITSVLSGVISLLMRGIKEHEAHK